MGTEDAVTGLLRRVKEIEDRLAAIDAWGLSPPTPEPESTGDGQNDAIAQARGDMRHFGTGILKTDADGNTTRIDPAEFYRPQAKEIERLRAELAETIAAFPLGAVKAERDRCAKIAETTEREGWGGGAYNEAGRDIAAAIRNQKP